MYNYGKKFVENELSQSRVTQITFRFDERARYVGIVNTFSRTYDILWFSYTYLLNYFSREIDFVEASRCFPVTFHFRVFFFF